MPEESFTAEYVMVSSVDSCLLMCSSERREHKIFGELLKTIPGLEERLLTGSETEVGHVAELVSVKTTSTCFA